MQICQRVVLLSFKRIVQPFEKGRLEPIFLFLVVSFLHFHSEMFSCNMLEHFGKLNHFSSFVFLNLIIKQTIAQS